MRNLLSSYVLVSLLMLVSGCALTTEVTTLMPAKAGEVLEFRKVAVLDFSADASRGNKDGKAYSAAFEVEISQVKAWDKKLYVVMDRVNIENILKEQKFQMTATETSEIEAGKLLGVQAIWTGVTVEDYSENTWYETETVCTIYDNKTCVVYTNNVYKCIAQNLSINITPKLVDVATSKIVFTKTFNAQSSNSRCRNFVAINRAELWKKALKDILRQFGQEIAPYNVKYKVELMTEFNDIKDEKIRKLCDTGTEFAENQKIDQACTYWNDALKLAPYNLALDYNSAICKEVKGNYAEAVTELTRIEHSTPKSNKLVTEALDRNKRNAENKRILTEQLGK